MISPGYQFTTEDFDDPRIEELKEKASRLNEQEKALEKKNGVKINSYSYGHGNKHIYETRTRYYVWCRGRGSRTDPEKIKAFQHVWKQKYGNEISKNYAKHSLGQDLPLWMAERTAVYLMKRRVHKDISRVDEIGIGHTFYR